MTGKRLRQFREAKGWTQKQLAKQLGIDPTEVSHYERGSRVPSLTSAVAIQVITAASPLGCIQPWEWVRKEAA